MRATDDHAATSTAAAGFASILYWAVVVVVAFSLIGLFLAVAGWFRPWSLALGAIPAAVAIGWWGWRHFRDAVPTLISGGVAPVVAVIGIMALSACSAALFPSEQVLNNRDPGVYLTTGLWLADEGSLLTSGKIGGFEGIDELSSASLGYYEVRDDGTVDPQFLHLLPVWAAVARWIGGDAALFRVNALAIALAIAAFWLFAAMLVRPWYAVVAAAALAVSLPTVHFARNLYSEPIALLFVFSGLAMLIVARRTIAPAIAVLAGMLIGAVAMVRIDGWLVVIGVLVSLMATWWVAEQIGERQTRDGFVHPALLGMLASGAVALFDGVVRARPYLTARSDEIVLLFAALIGVVLLGYLALRRPAPVARLVDWCEKRRQTIAWIVPVVIVVAAVLALMRPFVQEAHGASANPFTEAVQAFESEPIDGTRTYAELTMRWLSWYLGPLGLALGVAGAAWAWRRAILGAKKLWPFLLSFSLAAGLYVLRPSITPDQLWAMRRFLPVVLPGLILLAVMAAAWTGDHIGPGVGRSASLGVAAVVLVVVPATFTWPLRSSTSYVGLYAAVQEVCDALPSDAAVLMATRYQADYYQAPVRSFCGVPVTGIGDDAGDVSCLIADAAAAWKERGVALVVGYDGPLVPDPQTAIEVRYDIPELTLKRRPHNLASFRFGIDLVAAESFDACER